MSDWEAQAFGDWGTLLAAIWLFITVGGLAIFCLVLVIDWAVGALHRWHTRRRRLK